MEEEICPFCWGENILLIHNVSLNGSERTRSLMECLECEKFYWNGTEEEIISLSEICKTKILEPKKCYEDVKDPFRSGFLTYPKQKVIELNLICSECPNRQFAGKEEITYIQSDKRNYSY